MAVPKDLLWYGLHTFDPGGDRFTFSSEWPSPGAALGRAVQPFAEPWQQRRYQAHKMQQHNSPVANFTLRYSVPKLPENWLRRFATSPRRRWRKA